MTIALLGACAACAAAEGSVTLNAPTDFAFDPDTGAYSFNAVDENAGYYFIRIYPVARGEEAAEYVASSRRINATTGEKTGSIDVSGLGWGSYHIKLITFAASGTSYETPEPVVLSACYGVGGKLCRPEMMVVADGNTLEVVLDWYTLSDWKDLQYMPMVRFTVYGDAALTQAVASVDFDTNTITYDAPPFPGYIWESSRTVGHINLRVESTGFDGTTNVNEFCLTPQAAFTVETAGTYYVTAQAISDDETIVASSEASEAIAVELTAEEPDYADYSILTTSLWVNPSGGDFLMANVGAVEGRVDEAAGQVTTSRME